MLLGLLVNVFLPSLIIAAALAGIYFYLSSYRHKGLPCALAEGFAGSNYVLTRGKQQGVSDFFYDIDSTITNYEQINAVSDFYASSIHKLQKNSLKINRLAFIEKDSGPVGAITLLGLLSVKTEISSIIIRQRRRLLLNSFKGDFGDLKNNNIVIISDVATSGGGIKSAIKKLESNDAKIIGAVVLVNRMKKEDEDILGIPLLYAFRINEKSDLEKEPINFFIRKKMRIKNSHSQLAEAA